MKNSKKVVFSLLAVLLLTVFTGCATMRRLTNKETDKLIDETTGTTNGIRETDDLNETNDRNNSVTEGTYETNDTGVLEEIGEDVINGVEDIGNDIENGIDNLETDVDRNKETGR